MRHAFAFRGSLAIAASFLTIVERVKDLRFHADL